jgi:hypothetical protein
VRPPQPEPCVYTSDSKLSRPAQPILKVYVSCPFFTASMVKTQKAGQWMRGTKNFYNLVSMS